MTVPIQSMTGFSQIEGPVTGGRLRIELKAVNHRYLDLKVRLPREYSAAEVPLRAAVASKFSRGAIEVKIERVVNPETPSNSHLINADLAAEYATALTSLNQRLGLSTPVTLANILSMPEVVGKNSAENTVTEPWTQLQPLITQAFAQLTEMRQHEGAALVRSLLETISDLEAKTDFFKVRRKEWEAAHRSKFQEKIRAVFDAYPVANTSITGVLESRIAQELAILLDRTDIEEEVTRFRGHLEHFRKILREGGQVGRKLDFLLQELNREINTLANKAQDLALSEEAVAAKVRIEQLREQVMNLE